MNTRTSITDEFLEEIVDAFNRQDVEAIVSYFAEDGFFRTARGDGPEGTCLRGHEEIRTFLSTRWREIPDLRWEDAVNRRCGDHFAVSEWRVRGTLPNGEAIDWLGCDLYEFDDYARITRKETYWKGPAS